MARSSPRRSNRGDGCSDLLTTLFGEMTVAVQHAGERVRVAAIQLRVDEGEPAEARRERALEHVRAEAGRGADLLVLPELWSRGFFSPARLDK
jgi:hypothetical protein